MMRSLGTTPQTIIGEPVDIFWTDDVHPQGDPYKSAKLKVTNQTGTYYSWFRLVCKTPHGKFYIDDGSGILANSSEYRTYLIGNNVAEIFKCELSSALKGKPTAYQAGMYHSTWGDRKYGT